MLTGRQLTNTNTNYNVFFCSIPSISSELDEHLPDIVKMIEWTKGHIERLGGKTTMVENPVGTKERPLPPILLGEFAVDPKKKTVCVYGHLDVQPAAKEDGWDTDPFVLTEKDGKLYGRGSTDDKGPALSWLWIVEAHQAMGVELPVNIKIMYEGMEEFGSAGVFEIIAAEAQEGKFLNDVVRTFCSVHFTIHRYRSRVCVRYSRQQFVSR